MQNGCVALVVERELAIDCPQVGVTDVRAAMTRISSAFNVLPERRMKLVGVTGTKGKSTTTYYLKYIFDEFLAAKKQAPSGVIGGSETYDGVEKFESHLTTPEPLELERHFANAVSSGIRYLSMEVSSQAL